MKIIFIKLKRNLQLALVFCKENWVIVLIFIFLVMSGLLFKNGQPLHNGPINAERFSQYGDFVGGLLSAFTLIFILYTFRNTKKQSFDTTFFNLLQLHDSIVRDFKANVAQVKSLNEECRILLSKMLENKLFTQAEYDHYIPEASDFFEISYRKLLFYRVSKRSNFFKDENWRIGHFLTSLISLMEIINENSIITIKEKAFYARTIKNRASSDELRIIFYYVIYMFEEKKLNVKHLFTIGNFDFFADLPDPLISEEIDRIAYKEIGQKTL